MSRREDHFFRTWRSAQRFALAGWRWGGRGLCLGAGKTQSQNTPKVVLLLAFKTVAARFVSRAFAYVYEFVSEDNLSLSSANRFLYFFASI